jgi:hypothetical protein
MNTNRLLAAVLVLQVVTLAGQWGGHAVRDARADLPPDPGAQRVAQTEELKSINRNLDRLVRLMESGRVEVRVGNVKDFKDTGNANANANARK